MGSKASAPTKGRWGQCSRCASTLRLDRRRRGARRAFDRCDQCFLNADRHRRGGLDRLCEGERRTGMHTVRPRILDGSSKGASALEGASDGQASVLRMSSMVNAGTSASSISATPAAHTLLARVRCRPVARVSSETVESAPAICSQRSFLDSGSLRRSPLPGTSGGPIGKQIAPSAEPPGSGGGQAIESRSPSAPSGSKTRDRAGLAP